MFRNSDLWILLALAAIVGWRHKDDVQSALHAAEVTLRQSMPQREVNGVQESVTAIADNRDEDATPFGGRRILYSNAPFEPLHDCSQVPPGSIIIHDVGYHPVWGPPFVCREY